MATHKKTGAKTIVAEHQREHFTIPLECVDRRRREISEAELAEAGKNIPRSARDAEPARDEMELPKEISSRTWRNIIKNRLEAEDYSFRELGTAIGVSPSVVMRFIKGERDVRVGTAEKMCVQLDLVLVPREWLSPAIGDSVKGPMTPRGRSP
jgi:ribosome-binding protein aMBF1 (putative translation factor)